MTNKRIEKPLIMDFAEGYPHEEENKKLFEKVENVISKYKNDKEIDPELLRDKFKDSLKKGQGNKPQEEVKERELVMAREMLDHRLKIEKGETTQKIDSFAVDLAKKCSDKYNREYEKSDCYKSEKKHFPEVGGEQIAKDIEKESGTESNITIIFTSRFCWY